MPTPAEFLDQVRKRSGSDAARVLQLVPDLEEALRKARRQAWSKPGRALDAYQRIAGLLAPAVPAALPALYEHAARVFVSTDHGTYAARMLAAAREAEVAHGLDVDDDHIDEIFLAFAVAGALPVKAMGDYAKELTGRLPTDEAFRRYARLCVRRTEAGLAPAAPMAAAIRRLAKAAGDQAALEQAYLAEMVGLPAIVRAPAGWWSAHRTALVALAEREPRVRGTLLGLIPGYHRDLTGAQIREVFVEWLALLERCGATAALDDAVPDEARPAGGTAGWLDRLLTAWSHGWGGESQLPGLNPLVRRIAGRLRAELAATGGAVRVPHDLDLLDLLLELDVPVADPDEDHYLELDEWAARSERRELWALAADPRFAAAFARKADGYHGERHLRTIRTLAASPGGRSMLTGWVRDIMRRSHSPGLPGLLTPHRLLEWLPADIRALGAGDERLDLVTEIVRTLRGGLVGELCWPAYEKAVAEVLSGGDRTAPLLVDAWPYLVVAGDSEVRVVGRDGCVLSHTFRLPADHRSASAGFQFVDGALLVFWRTLDGRAAGYWHVPGRPDPAPAPLAGAAPDDEAFSISREWGRGLSAAMTLPVPGGGRTAGGAVLRPGGTAVPDAHLVIGDGSSFWAFDTRTSRWVGYDPATGARNTASPPVFVAKAGEGTPVAKQSWIRPADTDAATPLGTPVDGLLGWRVTELPGGAVRGEDLAGRTVTIARPVRGGHGTTYPFAALTLPGDERLRALLRNEHGFGPAHLVDPDGVVTATDDGPFAANAPHLPPQAYWTMLRPRDPNGSVALRGVGRETAAALFEAALAGEEDLPALVRRLIPQISDRTLAAGVAGVARFAAERCAFLAGLSADGRERPEPEVGDPRTDPRDDLLGSALSGLYLNRHTEAVGFHRIGGVVLALPQLRAMHRALTDDESADAPAGRLHLDGPGLRSSSVVWDKVLGGCAAIAFRAAADTTPLAEREALRRLLTLVDTLGLDSARTGRWRRFDLHLDAGTLAAAGGGDEWDDRMRGVLSLGDGAFLAFVEANNPVRGPKRDEYGCDFVALFHDPAGRFEVPVPYTVRSSTPIGTGREPGWLRRFLTEWAERGPVTWKEPAAEEFARLTGVVPTLARLLVAGLPESQREEFPSPELRTRLSLDPAVAAVLSGDVARLGVRGIPAEAVGALLPEDPARLWTEGPDIAAAAEVWNATVGRRTPVPEALLTEGAKAGRQTYWGFDRRPWPPSEAVQAMGDPAGCAELTRDLRWVVEDVKIVPADPDTVGFTGEVLVGTVTTACWLAHRLPAGDPLRRALPTALALARDRLAAPGMLLGLGSLFELPPFRAAVGEPDETGGPDEEWHRRDHGWQRYGAIIVPDHDHSTRPIIRTALLDDEGGDPNLPIRYGLGDVTGPRTDPCAEALRLVHDPRFAALLADPGDPAAGERDKDGTWWPQDPARSVPKLVAELAGEHTLTEDTAALYLILLALPDPTDRNVARWTGWKPARLKAARAELAATDLVVEGRRARAGRSLFLPGGWEALKAPHLPLETWKAPLFGVTSSLTWGGEKSTALGTILPTEPVADLFRRVWRRVQDGDAPCYE
ncbi:DNA-binding protein [Actinoallomurus vinaceus]|uniref:DNA-binding protein n=1 Tax=Actinoallomurus vinaceus TaxID=1080074 RepID=A0ABP8U8L2_9ACTN